MVGEIDRTQWTIVLVGRFNPAIFHPSWLQMHEVVSRDVGETAEVVLVHKDMAIVKERLIKRFGCAGLAA